MRPKWTGITLPGLLLVPSPRPTPWRHLASIASANVLVDARMIKTGFDPNTSRCNFHLESLLRNDDLLHAQKLFNEMPSRNIVTVNTLISGYIKCGDIRAARELFDKMTTRTNVSWTIMMGGYARYGFPMEAFRLYKGMYETGMVMPDHVTFTTSLSGFDNEKMWVYCVQVHAHVVRLGFKGVITVGNTLIDSYCKCRRMDLAFTIFDEIPRRECVSYSGLIAGCSNEDLNQEAVDLFFGMQNEGYELSEFTFAVILSTAVVEEYYVIIYPKS